MQLSTLMGLRPVAGAGLLVTLTRRCPLSCAHCSTSSSMAAEQIPAGPLRAFFSSITAETAPQVVLFTGGEPLLRPRLVREFAELVKAKGSAPAVLTGGFFARGGVIPDRILATLLHCEHVSFSLDAFHEREVDRADVFAALQLLLDRDRAVSLHLLGTGPDDEYLADVTRAVQRRFGTAVPMLVTEVRPVGRAAGWLNGRPATLDERPRPCSMAAWPVVAFDGSVLACCNQRVVDARPTPEHLLLGQVGVDPWPEIVQRMKGRSLLRMIRTVGPVNIQHRFAAGPCDGSYCGTCRGLSDDPAVRAGADLVAAGPVGALLDEQVGLMQRQAGPAKLLTRYASARYAELVSPS